MTAGGILKSLNGWVTPNVGATDSLGFSGLPGGLRNASGAYGNVGFRGTWWSDRQIDTTFSGSRFLTNDGSQFNAAGINKTFGVSVRLIKE
jgi:uncharacterized protein (TIGR02145 family)